MTPSITLKITVAGDASEASFEEDSVVVGRGASSTLRLEDRSVSTIHAVIKRGPKDVSVTDLGSERGTWLNGLTVAEPTPLSVGDVLKFGEAKVEILSLGVDDAKEAEAGPAKGAGEGQSEASAEGKATDEPGTDRAGPESDSPASEAPVTQEQGPSSSVSGPRTGTSAAGSKKSEESQASASAPPAMPPASTGQREKQVKLHHEEPKPGAHIITDESDINPKLISQELAEKNQPTDQEKALEVSIFWGDTVVSEAQVRRPGPVRVGSRVSKPRPTLEVDGGFPVDAFTIANLGSSEASIVVPSQSKVAVRKKDGTVVHDPQLSPADPGFPAGTFDLKVGDRLVYKSGTVTVVAQFVRGNAVMGRAGVMDFFFPAILSISLLLHVFFVVATFITPNLNEGLIDDLFKNQNRFAQMILKAPEEEKKRKKLDLSGMKGGAKHKDDEGKFAKKDKPKKDKLASKAGAPRVDPNKREKDRKIALNSGLLSILKGAGDAGAVSNVFGPGGLGTGINNAMGGLRGTEMGDAGGAGGLGTRGTGAGGGGNSLGIGGLGTHGHGRGTGGYGNIDLGGRGKGRTRIVPGRTIIKGSLSKAEIGRVIRRNLARFRFCYEKQLASNPNLGGKISVYFTIAPTGSVAKATVRETSMNDATVEACVLKVMRSLKFPKPKGGGIVVVTYPFVFAAT